jgi:3-hydroxyacyl-[acyl-carrier-protein] dehydratase
MAQNVSTKTEGGARAGSNSEIDLDRIKQVLPHRPPFLFVERLIDIVEGESATGLKTVSANEDYFQGHFPAVSVMPGVLIVEAMAQTAGALVMHSLDLVGDDQIQRLVYFMSIDSCRFRKRVSPGVTLHLPVKRIHTRGNVHKFQGKAEVDGVTVAEARFTAMIAEI